ncbi:type IV pilin protein [Pseudomonas indica]|jgi:type IV pilus assembly protein PilE|uniref:type IV pilin protein n=1 Tax=Pseudomonas indica TaxID=137658 RepID=UPI0023F94EA0|nr:type IV pilin protein [Pseudomonas indica]
MTQPKMKRRQNAFTLIELMIVVAVIGILAAIAYPSYQEHVRKARRADAQTALMESAQHMERYFTAKGTYLNATLPYSESPKDGSGTKFYDLRFATGSPTATAYVIQAAPKNGMANDKCGTLTLSNTGLKGQATTATTAECWRR